MNVLSLFDGMSCGQLALNKAGFYIGKYYASEIDKYAIKVTHANYPGTIQLGDITKWREWDIYFSSIDLVLAGSPCQGFSFAGKGLNFKHERSKLFFVFVEILNHIKELNPKVLFLLENVMMKREHEWVISRYMGVNPIQINSALLTAQNRVRNYWTNINQRPVGLFGYLEPDILQPKDKGILLKDILESEVDEKYFISEKALQRVLRTRWSNPQFNPEKTGTLLLKNNSGQMSVDNGTTLIIDVEGNPKNNQDKAACLSGGAHSGGNHSDMDLIVQCVAMRGRNIVDGKRKDYLGAPTEQRLEANENGKTNTHTSVQKDNLLLSNSRIRRLTEIECERLQGVSDNFTNHVSSTQRYKMLGNGWTVDVIAHILSYIK